MIAFNRTEFKNILDIELFVLNAFMTVDGDVSFRMLKWKTD